jgi:hypothetical protein
MSLTITPETKIEALLDAFPGLDGALTECVPALSRLQNPVLRKAFFKTATLEQAARLGGVNVRDVVLKLRERTGQPLPDEPAGSAATNSPVTVVERIDADAMLAQGVHPVGRVRQACTHLAKGEAVEMSVGFRPAPLMDLMQREGFLVTCEPAPAGGFVVRFVRP